MTLGTFALCSQSNQSPLGVKLLSWRGWEQPQAKGLQTLSLLRGLAVFHAYMLFNLLFAFDYLPELLSDCFFDNFVQFHTCVLERKFSNLITPP